MPKKPNIEVGIKRVSVTATSVGVITPSNSTVLDPQPKGIYVGTTGDVAVTMVDGSTATFKDVPAGITLPIAPSKVNATGTTATDLVALYE